MSADFKTAIEELCRRAKIPEPNWGKEDKATRLAARAREDVFSVACSVFVGWLWKDVDALVDEMLLADLMLVETRRERDDLEHKKG